VRKVLPLLVIAFCMLIGACKKDVPDFTGFEDTTEDVNGNYQPTTKGSYWMYASSGEGQDADTLVTTMLGTTVKFGDKTYKAATSKIASEITTAASYFYHSGGTYIERDIEDGETTEILYLKSGAAIGDTWEAIPLLDPSQVDGSARALGKMVEKNISKTIFGKPFNNVIHTQIDLQVKNDNGDFETFTLLDYYIAKDIGVIESDATILGVTVKSELYNYSIK
jgi:hypothetical protein